MGLSVLNGTRNSYFCDLRHHQSNRCNDSVFSYSSPWGKWGISLSFRVFCPGTAPGQPWDKLMALRMEQAHLASRRLRKQPVTPADSKLPRQSKHNLTCTPPSSTGGVNACSAPITRGTPETQLRGSFAYKHASSDVSITVSIRYSEFPECVSIDFESSNTHCDTESSLNPHG